MFGSDILEVAIGLVFIYFLISLLCTALTEWIARIFAMRSGNLKQGIIQLLEPKPPKEQKDKSNGGSSEPVNVGSSTQPNAGTQKPPEKEKIDFFDHPLIKGLIPKDRFYNKAIRWIKGDKYKIAFPSQLPARTVSEVLLDILGHEEGETGDPKKKLTGSLADQSKEMISRIEENIGILPPDLKKILGSLLDTAKTKSETWQDAIVEFRSSIEKWFDDAMDRVSGWYKRKTQYIVLGSALVICFALNVDTYAIANSLYHDAVLRSSVVAAAEVRAQQPVSDNTTPEVTELLDEVAALKLPIGWGDDNSVDGKAPSNSIGWLIKIGGVLFTAILASLGSTFWFDLLNKIVNLRASGKKPEEVKAEKSKAS